MSEKNPYEAPKAIVSDAVEENPEVLLYGRRVGIGRGAAWIGEGWRLFRMEMGLWIGVTAFLGLIFVMPIINYLTSIFYPLFNAGVMKMSHDLWEDQPTSFGELFVGFKHRVGSLLLVLFSFIATIIITIGVFIIMGVGFATIADPQQRALTMALAILVALALMIPVYAATWYAPALILLNDFEFVQALKSSFIACMKNFLPLFLWSVLITLLLFVAMLPLLLGLFVLMPVMFASVYASYRDIFYPD
jgi:uncharacterized membrane protein